MTLHFAYGSNMSRAQMGARCRGAEAVGIAVLSGWRFVINPEGFGSIAPQPGGRVHGVLWRVSARALSSVHAPPNVAFRLHPPPPPAGAGRGRATLAAAFISPPAVGGAP